MTTGDPGLIVASNKRKYLKTGLQIICQRWAEKAKANKKDTLFQTKILTIFAPLQTKTVQN